MSFSSRIDTITRGSESLDDTFKEGDAVTLPQDVVDEHIAIANETNAAEAELQQGMVLNEEVAQEQQNLDETVALEEQLLEEGNLDEDTVKVASESLQKFSMKITGKEYSFGSEGIGDTLRDKMNKAIEGKKKLGGILQDKGKKLMEWIKAQIEKVKKLIANSKLYIEVEARLKKTDPKVIATIKADNRTWKEAGLGEKLDDYYLDSALAFVKNSNKTINGIKTLSTGKPVTLQLKITDTGTVLETTYEIVNDKIEEVKVTEIGKSSNIALKDKKISDIFNSIDVVGVGKLITLSLKLQYEILVNTAKDSNPDANAFSARKEAVMALTRYKLSLNDIYKDFLKVTLLIYNEHSKAAKAN